MVEEKEAEEDAEDKAMNVMRQTKREELKRRISNTNAGYDWLRRVESIGKKGV